MQNAEMSPLNNVCVLSCSQTILRLNAFLITKYVIHHLVFMLPVSQYLLSVAERRGTPVLLSAWVSNNSGNSPQMAAPRRSREIDQSTQCFHVGCDNRCLLGNEYGGIHGREFLGRTFMILILPNQAVCVTLSVIKIPPLAQPSLF